MFGAAHSNIGIAAECLLAYHRGVEPPEEWSEEEVVGALLIAEVLAKIRKL